MRRGSLICFPIFYLVDTLGRPPPGLGAYISTVFAVESATMAMLFAVLPLGFKSPSHLQPQIRLDGYIAQIEQLERAATAPSRCLAQPNERS
jgi:hypothetical protein